MKKTCQDLKEMKYERYDEVETVMGESCNYIDLYQTSLQKDKTKRLRRNFD